MSVEERIKSLQSALGTSEIYSKKGTIPLELVLPVLLPLVFLVVVWFYKPSFFEKDGERDKKKIAIATVSVFVASALAMGCLYYYRGKMTYIY